MRIRHHIPVAVKPKIPIVGRALRADDVKRGEAKDESRAAGRDIDCGGVSHVDPCPHGSARPIRGNTHTGHAASGRPRSEHARRHTAPSEGAVRDAVGADGEWHRHVAGAGIGGTSVYGELIERHVELQRPRWGGRRVRAPRMVDVELVVPLPGAVPSSIRRSPTAGSFKCPVFVKLAKLTNAGAPVVAGARYIFKASGAGKFACRDHAGSVESSKAPPAAGLHVMFHRSAPPPAAVPNEPT